jgi:molybdopterin/thiamine biosynthesis adenylyltransferase
MIRIAIRNHIDGHEDVVPKSIERHTMELGLRDYSVADRQVLRNVEEALHVKVVGLARIAADVTPELALATIGSISVLRALQASAEVKMAIADSVT